MKITAVTCALLGNSPVIRVVTDEGIDGFGQIESYKPYAKACVPHFAEFVVGMDPTNVESVLLRIRRRGGNKPWGSVVSAIEMALWDIAGKAAGLPVHKLLGGKVRDRVRVYNGGVRVPREGNEPEDFAELMRRLKNVPEGFTLIKQAIGYHDPMAGELDDYSYSQVRTGAPHPNRGLLTERGLEHTVECVAAMKEVLGDEVGLALDCGPGWTRSDAIRFARRVEPYHLVWLEDLLTGDYVPWTDAGAYRDLTTATATPIHTGEQLYLRHNFRDLIEQRAVDVIGPDPADVGGIAELKWIAEYADLHGISMAPHGVYDGLIGLGALVQVCATLPDNFIAFEYPVPEHPWWYDIVEGWPEQIVVDGHVQVSERPGLGVTLIPEEAGRYLSEEDRHFFE
ncbi:mandelate racemase/muconate lactonizing enzyme family protein [Streptomyces tubbatahanensis]|uniref:Mandelate racemase/muconate lactonizing enzyme family protein n=1 Tax=Streptomyces tubbatahanensis TaxID=2923272 RepID=A0ABY3XLP0_9ACTN|nr:mandelate racemase/muconate lactonizing enzyme family protein [Streptomyces tubbatahanensis]UNS95325.1 mandelate racemase/muconate lactonizing enzyme family protein [Streptomyces tubbatahanensis]